MLAAFLASHGGSSFNSKQLAHELDHDSRAVMAVVDHDHAVPSINGSADPEPLSDIDHLLLHAEHHCQPLPSSTIKFAWTPPARTMLLLPDLPVLPAAALDTPFRPPRSPALI